MDIQTIQYLTIMPFGKSSVIASGETTYGKTFEFPIVTSDTIDAILEKVESEQSETEKRLVQVQKELEAQKETVGDLVSKNQKLSEDLTTQSTKVTELESGLTLTKQEVKESKERIKAYSKMLDIFLKTDVSKMNFYDFSECVRTLKKLKTGDGVRYDGKNYLVILKHIPSDQKLPPDSPDLYYPVAELVKEELIELVQGTPYNKGVIGSFRGTVYKSEKNKNTAPIGTPGYWTNLGPVSNYNK